MQLLWSTKGLDFYLAYKFTVSTWGYGGLFTANTRLRRWIVVEVDSSLRRSSGQEGSVARVKPLWSCGGELSWNSSCGDLIMRTYMQILICTSTEAIGNTSLRHVHGSNLTVVKLLRWVASLVVSIAMLHDQRLHAWTCYICKAQSDSDSPWIPVKTTAPNRNRTS